MQKVFSITVLLTISLSSSFAQKNTALPYVDSTWNIPIEPFRIAGNLYYVGTYDLACYLIATPKGHVLINTGLAESVPIIRKNIETLGFKFNDLKYLLTTQAHYDHMGGMAEIKKLTEAKMLVHADDAAVVEDGGNSDFIFGGKGSLFTPVTVDRKLKDHDIIKIDQTNILALHHPGHTKGSMSYLIEVKDEVRSWRVLIVNMPTILSAARIFGMPAYPNIGKDYQRTLKDLKEVEFDIWVASHGSQFGLNERRKAGDKYRPEAFGDKKAYETAIGELSQAYDEKVKSGQ